MRDVVKTGTAGHDGRVAHVSERGIGDGRGVRAETGGHLPWENERKSERDIDRKMDRQRERRKERVCGVACVPDVL